MSIPQNPVSLFQSIDTWQPRGLAMITGNKGVSQLSHLWIAHLAMQDRPVYIIDCAIRFNVFVIAEEILINNMQPEIILGNILIRRDFTPYQLLTTMKEILANPGPYTYFFLSPTKQFFDNDVAKQEGLFLLNKMLEMFAQMRQQKIPALIVEKANYRHPHFQHIYPKLMQLASPVWQVTPEYSIDHPKPGFLFAG